VGLFHIVVNELVNVPVKAQAFTRGVLPYDLALAFFDLERYAVIRFGVIFVAGLCLWFTHYLTSSTLLYHIIHKCASIQNAQNTCAMFGYSAY
jgi:hypothetical protein